MVVCCSRAYTARFAPASRSDLRLDHPVSVGKVTDIEIRARLHEAARWHRDAVLRKQFLTVMFEKKHRPVPLHAVMSGIEYLRELRVLPGGDAPIVLFCTTENDIEHIQEAMAAGANEYIMKPFDSEIIQAKFDQVGLL